MGEQPTITVRLQGEQIPVDAFVTVVGSLTAILRAVEAASSEGTQGSLPWRLRYLASGSAVVTLDAEPLASDPARTEHVIGDTLAGLRILQGEHPLQELPPRFSLGALRKVRDISAVLDDGVQGITISGMDVDIAITEQLAANVDRFIRGRYEAFGSVEGVLRMVSIAGAARFSIFDTVAGRAINCYIPAERLEEAVRAFARRVSAYGTLHLNALGEIVSVTVEELYVLRGESDLPSIDEFIGSIPDLTGGTSPEEYVRRLRDG